MNSRARLLLTCATCAIVISVGPAMLDAHAQTANKGGDVWTNGAPPLDTWWSHGEVEVGGRFFLNDPQKGGVASQGGKSLAKYYEYSTIKPGPFSDIWLATGSRNGLYEIDIGGKNIGYSDQNYYLDVSKAGEQYFNFGWDQTPHVYSTSAQTLYNGVGTTALTLPGNLGTQLFNAATFGGAKTTLDPTQAGKVQQVINANLHQTDIGIRRDTAAVEYRWTPTEAWDIRANYSNMHRWGTQVDGVVFTPGTSGVRVDGIKPVDDTTQNFGVNGEYAGTSFWGKKYTFKVGYNGSVFNDANSAYTVQNPFCNSVTGVCPNSGNNGSYKIEQMPLWPDNRADSVTATFGADLPAKSRYMGTASYGWMRQNQAFLPFSINPAPLGWAAVNGTNPTLTSSLPAASLNGAVNTLLLNNVVTTQITPEWKSKLVYRYYDYNNTTPQLFFKDWVIADYISGETRTAEYAPFRSTTQSYTKQNAAADINWRPNRQWNLGAAYGYERYNWYGGDANITNENSGKVYADWKPENWVTMRASYLYAARRFDNYNNFAYVASVYWPQGIPPLGTPTNVIQNQGYRQLMFSDRDRNQAKLFVDLQVTSKLSITPTAGLQYDNYLNNVNIGSLTTSCAGVNCLPGNPGTYGGVPLTGTQPGLKHNNSWNWGLEGSYLFTPETALMLSYMHEYRDQQLFYCGNALPSGASTGNCSAFSTTTGFPSGSNDVVMKDTVDTFIARLRYAAIPNKLDLDVGYTLSIANASTGVTPGPFPSIATVNGVNGVTSVAGGPFPDQKTTFQRVDVIARYKLDDTLVHQLGFKGEVTAKFRYAYESNRVTNWQNDMMQNYMWSINNQTLGYMTWLAYNNPNYDAHLFGASLALKW